MKLGIKQIVSIGLAAVLMLPASLLAQVRFSVPMDAGLGKQLIENARAAQQEGNHGVALREYSRALEVYPNEPLVRAPIYRALSVEARADGDAALAKVYLEMAQSIEGDAGKLLEGAPAAITRGSGETASAVGQGALGMIAAILQARDAAKAAKLQKQQLQQQQAPQALAQPPGVYAYPQVPVGQPGYPPPAAATAYAPMPGYGTIPGQPDPNALQPGYPPPAQPLAAPQPVYPPPAQPQVAAQPGYPPPAQPQVAPQPGYPPPAQPQYAQQPGYPPPAQPQVAQQPGYPPPAQPQYAPQPGYPPPPQPQVAQQPGYPPPPQPQVAPQPGYPPQGQPQYAQQPGYPPQGQPQYAQQPGYPPQGQPQYAQQPGYPPQGQPQYAQQPGYPPQGRPQYAPRYAAPASPYGAPRGYAAPRGAMRGTAMKPLRVVHDHAVLGDAAYFADGCGALIGFDNGALTFTPSGGESPLVIPAGEVSEVRLNAVVGKEIGAFHIMTRKGLYLNLATESGKREDARAAVEELRRQLGLSE